ncbi:MAG TPA: xanthine dehydrogenase family protein subunit M [Acidimicrobiia bacterium]|nr:xanthine dehydrogenase family protein subunit M [Acidimicrobiia bacterium]HEU5448312.1 xanthine dehydrogenase family protein subunit M [Acidimicrobiia bacterium]
MYPSRFHYEAPSSLDEALQLLSMYQGEAKVLSGGMSLIPLMKLRFASPSAVIDVNNIPGLDDLFEDGGRLRIGALVRNRAIIRSDVVRARYPLMASVAPQIADPLVRGRSTLVGSLCHCDPQGDWGAVMLALDGDVVAVSSSGERKIPVSDFLLGPFQTALRPDELAIEARVPAPSGEPFGVYHKLERKIGDFATVGVAVFLDRSGDSVTRAGLGLTGVGATNVKVPAAEELLVRQGVNDQTIAEAARLAAEVARPQTDQRGSAEYKRHLVRTFVSRALGAAIGREPVDIRQRRFEDVAALV